MCQNPEMCPEHRAEQAKAELGWIELDSGQLLWLLAHLMVGL
jgi:hypothetical protein